MDESKELFDFLDSLPLISDNPEIQTKYEFMRLDGQSHNMAEILATRKFPGLKTDATFLSGLHDGKQFAETPELGIEYKRITEEEFGVNTAGKVYLSQLAAFPGDPEAWVSGRGDILRVCKERGWDCEGAVDYKDESHFDRPPTPDVPIAEDLISDGVDEILDQNPEMGKEEARDLYLSVRSKTEGNIEPAHIGGPEEEMAFVEELFT